MTFEEEQRELFKIASKKLGSAIGELADKTVSVKHGFTEYHAALKKLKAAAGDKTVWAVECKGIDDIYLFVSSNFEQVRKKIAALPDCSNPVQPVIEPKKKKKPC